MKFSKILVSFALLLSAFTHLNGADTEDTDGIRARIASKYNVDSEQLKEGQSLHYLNNLLELIQTGQIDTDEFKKSLHNAKAASEFETYDNFGDDINLADILWRTKEYEFYIIADTSESFAKREEAAGALFDIALKRIISNN